MKTPLNAILATSLVLALSGCNKPGDSSESTVKPYRETSFAEVTRQLDPGGSVYGYLATDQWLAGLSTNIANWGELASMLPGVSDSDRERIDHAFKSVGHVIETSGLENLTGIGVSGIQISPELHRAKVILHHNRGKSDGIFWNILGREPHALDGLTLLTEDTAVAAFGDLDVPLLWKTIEAEVRGTGVPELTQAVAEWPRKFEEQTKLSWDKFLASLGGEVGIVLTLDEGNMVNVPFAEGLQVPEPGLLLAIKVNDDLLYNRISAEMQKSGMARVTDEKGLRMAAIRVPIPVPLDLEVTVASSEGYLFVASSSAMVRNALAVHSGKADGLAKRPDFVELRKYLPADGNHFFYADKRFSGTIQSVQKAVLAKKDAAIAQSPLMEKLLAQKPTFGLAVGRHTATGWESVSVGNQDSATALVAAPAVGGVAVVSAVALPALARAKAKAQALQEESTEKSAE